MKVYLATRGTYSDYRVVRVFANEDDAAAYPLADDVEEYEVDEGPVEVRTWHVVEWFSHIPDRPETPGQYGNPAEESESRDFDGHERRADHRWERMGGPWHNPGDRVLTVEGWDLERVRKVYSEQRAEYLAVGHLRDAGRQP